MFGNRRLALIAFGLVIVVAVASFVVVDQSRKRTAVDDADRAAAAFEQELADFREAGAQEFTETATSAASEGNIETLTVEVDDRLAVLPRLETAGIPTHGMENSTPYERAQQSSAFLIRDFQELATFLAEDALVTAAFIEVGLAPFAKSLPDYFEDLAVPSAGAIRADIVDPFDQFGADIEAVEIPEGQEELAKDATELIDGFVAEMEEFADQIESGQGASINFSDEFSEVNARFRGLERAFKNALLSKVEALSAQSV